MRRMHGLGVSTADLSRFVGIDEPEVKPFRRHPGF